MSHHLITVLVQAAAAAEAKSQFLARMSHEIRTPLNGMIAVGQLLAETALSPAQWDLVNTVRCSGETLLTLISDILDFSRIEARLSPDPPGVPAGSTHLPACRGLLAFIRAGCAVSDFGGRPLGWNESCSKRFSQSPTCRRPTRWCCAQRPSDCPQSLRPPWRLLALELL